MRVKSGAISMLSALALFLSVVGQTRAGVVYSEDWSSLTGQSYLTQFSQIGNGNYELFPNLAALGWSTQGDGSPYQILGWFTTAGPYAGVNGILLNEGDWTSPLQGISSTITGLIPNRDYMLSFQYWGDNEPPSPYGLIYTINGQSNTVSASDPFPVAAPNLATFQFTASGSSTTLSFVENTPFGSGASPIIGAITVSDAEAAATPEPATITMLGLGITGMAGYGWRRRKQAAKA